MPGQIFVVCTDNWDIFSVTYRGHDYPEYKNGGKDKKDEQPEYPQYDCSGGRPVMIRTACFCTQKSFKACGEPPKLQFRTS